MLNDLPFFSTENIKVEDGKDGFSPTVTITDISNGHRLTITDITGTKTIDIMNGSEGPRGEQGLQGLQGIQGPKGETGEAGKSAYQYAQEANYSGTETDFAELLANSINKQSITLGIHTDGLLYIFIDGQPVGTGIAQNTNTET